VIRGSRHSFAELARQTMQQDKMLTVYDIQLIMGHSSFKTTEGYYRESADQDTSESMKAVFGREKKSNNQVDLLGYSI
jgi:integrase